MSIVPYTTQWGLFLVKGKKAAAKLLFCPIHYPIFVAIAENISLILSLENSTHCVLIWNLERCYLCCNKSSKLLLNSVSFLFALWCTFVWIDLSSIVFDICFVQFLAIIKMKKMQMRTNEYDRIDDWHSVQVLMWEIFRSISSMTATTSKSIVSLFIIRGERRFGIRVV